ncbi:MAG: EAL domain-containing protein [Desulfobacterales bacterium]|nr:EAL domain-containing protein [Desulfobacterales bacterium]
MKMNIRNKILIWFMSMGLIPVLLVALTAMVINKKALTDRAFSQLENVREVKTEQIKAYMEERRTDLAMLMDTVDGLRRAAFNKLRSVQENKKAQVLTHFHKIAKDLDVISKSIVVSRALKDFQSVVDDRGEFDTFLYDFFETEKYGDTLVKFRDVYGYYDLLLVTARGTVVYSSRQGPELGQSLTKGPLASTRLGLCFKQGLNGPTYKDFQSYPDAAGRYLALFGSPIKAKDNTTQGMVILKITPDAINEITLRRQGMGDTGETYLSVIRDGDTRLRSRRPLSGGGIGDRVKDSLPGKRLFKTVKPVIRIRETGESELSIFEPIPVFGTTYVLSTRIGLNDVIDPRRPDQAMDYFSKYVRAYGYTDLYLISPEGQVFYSAIDGPGSQSDLRVFSDTGLARIYRKVMDSKRVEFIDFSRADEETRPYAYLGAPLLYSGGVEMIAALKLPAEGLNTVMQTKKGLGKTTDIYLVGPDKRLRSDSFLMPETFSVIRSFSKKENIRLNTLPVKNALNGQTGKTIARDYKNAEVLSAYAPINIMGITWAVIAEIEKKEAFSSLTLFIFLVCVSTLLIAGLIFLFSLYAAKRLSAPVLALKAAAERVKNKEYDIQVAVDTNDELTLLAEAFNGMTLALKTRSTALEQKVLQLETAQAKVRKSEEALLLTESVFKNTIEGIAITNRNGMIRRVNQAFCDITGYSREEAVGKNPRILKSDRHDKGFYKAMWEDLLSEGQWSGEIWNRRKDGSAYPEWLSISAIRNDDGEITNFVSLFHDISEKKLKEEQLQFLAFHDPLTKLPNRKLLYDRATVSLRNARRLNEKMALLYMDLDNFKHINDSYGHPFGDEFLIQVKDRIQTICRDSDTFARYGGDEFVIVLNNITRKSEVIDFSNRILALFNTPVAIMGEEVFTSVSIGLAIFPDDGEDLVTLEKNADMALYEAKRDGKRRSFHFKQVIKDKMLRKIQLENGLRQAVRKFDSFDVFYQPKVDTARDDKVHSVEALLRWQLDGTPVSPAEFIPAAEETNLIIPIGEWLMVKAMEEIAAIHNSGYPDISLAINLSTKQFNDEHLLETISRILDTTRFPPDKLCFEITESIPMEDAARAIQIMHRLSAMGIKLSMDDFGTGYSSLSVLKGFPLNELKIDRSFVRDLPVNSNDAAICKTIIHMADVMGFNVVAEGVETEDQLEFFRKNQCHLIQGFHFYKPMGYENLKSTLKKS